MKFFEHSIFVRGRTWRIPKVDAMLDAALASILDAGGIYSNLETGAQVA